MKHFILLLFLAMMALAVHAQDTVYVYSNLVKVTHIGHKNLASYYYITNEVGKPTAGVVKVFNKKHKLYAQVTLNAQGEKDGLTTLYYPDGGKENEVIFQQDTLNGPFKKWYLNGQLSEEGAFQTPSLFGKGTEYLLFQYWDSLGNQLLSGGKGELSFYHKNGALKEKGRFDEGRRVSIWVGFYEDESLHYEEEYRQGQLIMGKSYLADQSYTYTRLKEDAQPIGGEDTFYQSMYKRIEYPRKAIKAGIQGTSYIRFVINEEGVVENAEPVEGRELGYGLDEEAMKVISRTKWHPAKQRGITVKSRKILPIHFTLQR